MCCSLPDAHTHADVCVIHYMHNTYTYICMYTHAHEAHVHTHTCMCMHMHTYVLTNTHSLKISSLSLSLSLSSTFLSPQLQEPFLSAVYIIYLTLTAASIFSVCKFRPTYGHQPTTPTNPSARISAWAHYH